MLPLERHCFILWSHLAISYISLKFWHKKITSISFSSQYILNQNLTWSLIKCFFFHLKFSDTIYFTKQVSFKSLLWKIQRNQVQKIISIDNRNLQAFLCCESDGKNKVLRTGLKLWIMLKMYSFPSEIWYLVFMRSHA